MATTAAGIALSGAHDAAQTSQVAKALKEVALIWSGTIDPYNLDATAPNYLSAAAASVASHHSSASLLAANYYDLLRDVEANPAALKASKWTGAKPASPLPPVAVYTSLNVTGPIAFKQAMGAGATIEQAQAKALKSTMGATTRLVEAGPRATIAQNTAKDHLAKGWMRRSQGVPCSFCAMLISRGPVYRSRATARFRAHDFCNCRAYPYFQGTGWTSQSTEYRDMWDEAQDRLEAAAKAANGGKLPTGGISSSDVSKEFATLYRARYPKTKRPDEVLDDAISEDIVRGAEKAAKEAAEAAEAAAKAASAAAKEIADSAIQYVRRAAEEAAEAAAKAAAQRAALEKKWKGKPPPKPPTPPVPPKNARDKAIDEWLAAMEARYDALGTGKPFSASYNYGYVTQAAAGDAQALAYLVTNKYADDALAAMLRRALATPADLLPEDEALYRKALRSYKNRATRHARYMDEWRDVNGATSSLRGMDGAKTFPTDEAALTWAEKVFPQISGEARDAAAHYTGSAYRDWNQTLRSHASRETPPPGSWGDYTRRVDEGMAKSLLPEDTVFYRGTNFDEFAFPGGTRTRSIPPPDPMDLVGTVQTQHGYGSVSLGGEASKGAFSGQVQLVLRVPQGHEAMLATRFSRFGTSEREVILGRSTSYFVHAVYKRGNHYVVEAEVIPFDVDPSSFAGAVPMPRTSGP